MRRAGRAGTGLMQPREGADVDEVKVGAVVVLKKRAGATTFQEDACIPLPRISKYHAFLTAADEGWQVADARSTFGTQVDGVTLEPLIAVPIADGAELMLGPYAFRFHTLDGLLEHLARVARVRGV